MMALVDSLFRLQNRSNHYKIYISDIKYIRQTQSSQSIFLQYFDKDNLENNFKDNSDSSLYVLRQEFFKKWNITKVFGATTFI